MQGFQDRAGTLTRDCPDRRLGEVRLRTHSGNGSVLLRSVNRVRSYSSKIDVYQFGGLYMIRLMTEPAA